jgi:hypothetical protein
MKPAIDIAARHFASKCLAQKEVPPGRHDVGRMQITIILPDGALVDRLPGSEGNGREACAVGKISALALLLFIARSGMSGPSTFPLWRQCIIDSLEDSELEAADFMPAEASAVLQEMNNKADCKASKKTPTTLMGKANALIMLDQLRVKEYKEVSSRMMAMA